MILFDDHFEMSRIDFYAGPEKKSHTVKLSLIQPFDLHPIPSSIVINNESSLIQISIKKIVEDTSIKNEIFTLTSPKGW